MSQIVQLSFLSEKEEEAILSVIEEDLKLQKEEERRIQYVLDYLVASRYIMYILPVGNYVMILSQASR